MKKMISGFLSIALFFLVLPTSTCKKTDGIDEVIPTPKGLFVISSGISKVMYFHYENLTYLTMTGRVQCQNDIGGKITAWKFVFKSGDRELLEINDANYSAYVLYTYGQLQIVSNTAGIVNVSYADKAHENFSPFSGRLFDADPDNMDIFMTIADDNANIQTIELNTAVTYNFY
jgi:hypothetical protein